MPSQKTSEKQKEKTLSKPPVERMTDSVKEGTFIRKGGNKEDDFLNYSHSLVCFEGEARDAVKQMVVGADTKSHILRIDASQSLVYRWIEAHVPTAQIEEITALASSVLDDRNRAVQWLSQPNAATDNRPPIDLIGENNGYERVKNLLLRIEYGVLA